LFFVGAPFLTRFASMLVGGVRHDARQVARLIAARTAPTAAVSPASSTTESRMRPSRERVAQRNEV
jgi:hypothetical protein